LKTANLKSEEVLRWQGKYESLTAKIEEKRRNKMFNVPESSRRQTSDYTS